MDYRSGITVGREINVSSACPAIRFGFVSRVPENAHNQCAIPTPSHHVVCVVSCLCRAVCCAFRSVPVGHGRMDRYPRPRVGAHGEIRGQAFQIINNWIRPACSHLKIFSQPVIRPSPTRLTHCRKPHLTSYTKSRAPPHVLSHTTMA